MLVSMTSIEHLAFSDSTLQTVYQSEAIKCQDLSCVRTNIDHINDEIIQLLVKRTAFVQRAGDFKLKTKVANDQKRVDVQLQVLLQKSEKLGLPTAISVEAFKAVIQHSIEFEQAYIDNKLK
jgi:isochorismate pyruvate lyase